ncbi:unnamed protein product, partial [Rotaria sp. Silwood2]
ESFFGFTFTNQILSIVINGITDKKCISMRYTLLFTQIFSLFNNLKYLNLDPSARCSSNLSFDNLSPTVVSSTLLELHVALDKFNDCLYLLDGRFNQLQTLCVSIFMIPLSHTTISNKEKISNLRCFSLHCNTKTKAYDELIVLLLQRMSNLEKLDLYFTVVNKPMFVDETDRAECLIYSYSYRLKDYDQISNNFSAGIFECVRNITLFDKHPFEHEFFLRLSQSFPFMKSLSVMNDKPQKNKLHSRPKKNNQDLPIIKYPHLVKLDLTDAHDDYIEQFLVDWQTSLSNIVRLSVCYRPLLRVTRNFTRNTTQFNCTKVIHSCLYDNGRLSHHTNENIIIET